MGDTQGTSPLAKLISTRQAARLKHDAWKVWCVTTDDIQVQSMLGIYDSVFRPPSRRRWNYDNTWGALAEAKALLGTSLGRNLACTGAESSMEVSR